MHVCLSWVLPAILLANLSIVCHRTSFIIITCNRCAWKSGSVPGGLKVSDRPVRATQKVPVSNETQEYVTHCYDSG